MSRVGYAAKSGTFDGAETGADTEIPVRAARDPAHPPRCSFAQEQFWFVDQLSPGNVAYNFSWPVRLRGPLDVAALERAFVEVVRRHESLRTGFTVEDGEPVQRVGDPGAFAL